MKKMYLLVLIMLVKLSIVRAQNYPTYVPSNGLDAWYSFTGNAKDSSGNNNHGTVSGATLTAGKSGIPNTAYSFNGSSNAIVLANPFLGGGQVSSFTIHSVVKLNSTINGGVIWGKSFFWGEVFVYVGTDNSIRISWANTYSGNKYSKMASQPNVIQTGVWYNIDIVYSNSSGQIYLNGAPITTNLEWIAQGGAVLSTTQIESRCNFNQIANSSEIGVFSNAGSPGTYFNGIIDEFGIWNRALTAQEISILYGRNCVISNFNPLQDTTKVCGTSTTLNAGAGFANYSWNTGVTTQSINVNSSGSKYLLTVANADGCSAKDSSYVDILNSSIVNNDTATCNVNSITLSTNSPATSSQIVLYDFSNCNLNGFTAQLTEGGSVGSATSTSSGLSGCGVNLIRPAILTTVRQDFSYGTYEVDARGGDGIANQYFNVMNIIDLDCRPSGTDDVGYGFYFNGVKVATATGTNPVSYPGWYHIKVRLTPDSISCWLGSTLIYNATYQTPLVNPYGPMAITTYSSSFYDNLKYTPYNNKTNNFLWSTGEITNSINVTPTQTTKYYSTIDNGITSCKDSVTVTVNAISSFNPLQDTLKICGTITSLNAGVGFATYSWNTGATSQTISPTASGKYKVTVANASGCTAIDSTYLAILNASIPVPDTTICKSDSISLSVETPLTKNFTFLTKYLDSSYYVSNQLYTWFEGRDYSVSLGGHLATFNSIKEDTLVSNKIRRLTTINSYPMNLATNHGECYIGLFQNKSSINYSEPAGGWEWITGEPVIYSNWSPVEPNNNSLQSEYGTTNWYNLGRWNDTGPGTIPGTNGKFQFVLELNKLPYSILWSTGDTTENITVSPKKTTTYYVTVNDGITSCMDSVTVTVSDISTFNPLQDTTKVCGVSSTLNAGSGFTSYSWSTGATSQTITPTASGKYKVTVTNTSGCTASDSTYLSIVNANILQNDTSICKGRTVSLSCQTANISSTVAINNYSLYHQAGGYFADPINDDYVTFPVSSTLNGNYPAWTMECWAKITSPQEEGILSIGNPEHLGGNVIMSNWTPTLWAYGNTNSGLSVTNKVINYSTAAWNHYALSYNNGTYRLFLNGVLQESWNSGNNVFINNVYPLMTNTHWWWRGGDLQSHRMTVFYDDIRVSKSCRYSSNFIPTNNWQNDINTLGLWNFNEGSGKIAYDLSGNNNNGIITGATYKTDVPPVNTTEFDSNSYLWTTGDTTETIKVTPTKTTTYYCTVSNGISSCVDSVTITVESVDTSLTVLDPPKVCTNGGSVRMQAGVASTYKWLKNGVIIPSATSSLYSALQTGIYRVVVTNSLGCSDTSRAVEITLYPIPSGTVKTPASNNICSGSTLLLTANGGDTYQWQLNGNNISGANSATYAASVPGVYTATLISSANCTAPALGSVSLSLLNKPTAAFTSQNNCVNVPVIFTNSSNTTQSGAVTYNWSFGNGVTSSQSSPIDQIYKTAGSYTAKLVISPTACPSLADSLSKVINIETPPPNIRYPAMNVLKNVPYLLQARKVGDSYNWVPSAGLSNARISNPSFNHTIGADYKINITNAAGCTIVDSLLIRAFGKRAVYVPKAFAPNGNGSNDLLRPILVGIPTINYFRIYNRWGQLIYETKNIGQGWDGRYKGTTQPIETYTWVFEGVDYEGQIVRESGKSTLLR